MPHLDSEHLLLLALGERMLDTSDLEHLAACATCQAEYDGLTAVASLARGSREVSSLPAPPPALWDRIAVEAGVRVGGASMGEPSAAPLTVASTGAAPGRHDIPAQTNGKDAPARLLTAVPSVGPSVAPSVEPARRRSEPTPRWRRSAALAVAAAVLGVVGTIGATHVTARLNQPVVTAQTDLLAFGPTPASAHGSARVLDEDGTTRLHIHVADLPASGGFYEVWLIDPDTSQMISLGVIGSESDVLLPLPSTVDLKTYRLVDVSAEPLDGNPTHSGTSLLRGTLTA